MVRIADVAPFKSARNKFNLSHHFPFTAKMGYAVPVLCLDFVPGDSFSISLNHLIRMMPLQTPSMTNINVRFDVFRVDNDFIKQVGNEDTPISWAYKTVPTGGFTKGSLADYLGFSVTTNDGGTVTTYGVGDTVDAMPFRAYWKIINDWYLNSNLQDPVDIGVGSGEDLITPVTLSKVNWRKDRFTSVLPTTQRGGDVILPIGTDADVVSNGKSVKINVGAENLGVTLFGAVSLAPGTNAKPVGVYTNYGIDGSVKFGSETGLKADLSNATGVSLNLLSSAEKLNRYRTLSLLGGDRYPEWQRVMWGIDSSDARLQRSEWIGSFKTPFIISEVLQTSETTSTSPQGSMSGHGFSSGGNRFYIPTLNSYGWIMIIMSVMPDADYQQGLPKKFKRESPFDYSLPIFQSLPLQPVYERELYWSNKGSKDSDGNEYNTKPLGYSPIFDEYRYEVNHVGGDFRDSLSHWLMTRIFNGPIGLTDQLIQADPSDRIFSVDQEVSDPLLCDVAFDIRALRKLPRVGLPRF